MRRREFIALLGSGVTAWPLAAYAQQMPIIGYLNAGSSDSQLANLTVFRQSLADAGYVVGQKVAIEYRWSRDQPDRLQALAAELVGRKVTILYAVSNAAAYLIGQMATLLAQPCFSMSWLASDLSCCARQCRTSS